VSAYSDWKHGRDHLSETSVTFSSQVFDCCQLEHLSLYGVSYCANADTIIDGVFTVANLPRWRINFPKVGYDLTLLLYTLRLLALSLRIRPKVILLSSGVTGWAFASLLKLSGAKIIPVLHNTLWPEGSPPSGLIAATRRKGLAYFWQRCVWVTLAVSPAARRQVEDISGKHPRPIHVFHPTFPAANFASAPAPQSFHDRPFRIMFAGRIDENKGVFDLLTIAQQLQANGKDAYRVDICGDGPDLARVNQQIASRGLRGIVKTHGRLNRTELLVHYLDSHVVIVPTRTTFAEGYAMVVAEAILLLRPVVTCGVVPAGEMFEGAIVISKADDVHSYVENIEALSRDETRYLRLVEQARLLRSILLDDSSSFRSVLRSLLAL